MLPTLQMWYSGHFPSRYRESSSGANQGEKQLEQKSPNHEVVAVHEYLQNRRVRKVHPEQAVDDQFPV